MDEVAAESTSSYPPGVEPGADGMTPLRYAHLPEEHFIHRADMRLQYPDGDDAPDAVVEIDVTDDKANGVGGLQGGMLATLVDCAAGRAVSRYVREGAAYATQDLNVHYLAPLGTGPGRASARVRKSSGRTLVVQVDVVDAGDEDRLCAVAVVAFAVFTPRAAVPAADT